MKNLLLLFLFITSIPCCAFGQKADELFVKAQAGDKEAQFSYAMRLTAFYPKESDYQKAIVWLQKSAEQGYSSAQNNLGYWYMHGYGVNKDLEQSFYWYKKAAEQGHKKALYNVAVCYEYGYGVKKSESDAFYWYKKAADQGNKDALFELGKCYYYAIGPSRDYQMAYEMFMKAVENHTNYEDDIDNIGDAMNLLGDIYYYGYGKNKNLTIAIEWYEKASDEDNPSAEYKLAQILLKGETVKTDTITAVELLLHAAGGGNLFPESLYTYSSENANGQAEKKLIELSTISGDHQDYILALLGCLYTAKEEYQKAELYYKKSIEKRNILGVIELGLMYFNVCANTPDLNPYYYDPTREINNGDYLELESYMIPDYKRCLDYVKGKQWTVHDNVAYWLEEAIENNFGSFSYGSVGYDLYDYLLYVYVNDVGGKKDLNKAIDVAYKCLIDTATERSFNAIMTFEIVGEKPELAEKLFTTYSNLYNEIRRQGINDTTTIGFASEGLGRCYYKGNGVGKSYEQAFNYFSIADKHGNNYAKCELGEMYYLGLHVDKEFNKAFELFNEAAIKYDGYEMTSNSMNLLSSCYRYGFGTTKDLQKAEYWLKKAQEAGNESANRINQIMRNKE